MKDYPNLPIQDRNTVYVLEKNLLPNEYEVFQKSFKKAHIVHELNIERGVPSKGTAICGRDCAVIEREGKIPKTSFCKDCLSKMNEKMEQYLYDEVNQEYYNPLKERF